MNLRHIAKYAEIYGVVFLLAFFASTAVAASIPTEQVDESQIHYGAVDSFETPAGVDFASLIRATPEYELVKKKKIKRGVGEYYVLMAKAGDRAKRAIAAFADESDFDLIASADYLENLDPPIEAANITDSVIEKMGETLNHR